MEARHVVAFMVFGLCLLIGTNGVCDRQWELQKCENVLGLNLNEILGKSPSWNRQELEKVCKSVDKFFTCFDDFVKRCSVTEFGKFQSVLKMTFSYMCGKGRELYLKTQVCMNQVNVTSELQRCNVGNYESIRTKDQTCNEKLKNCAQNAVSSCGEDGKKYIDSFMNEVLYNFIDCHGKNGFCDLKSEIEKCMNILLPGLNLEEILRMSPSLNRTQLEHACGSVDKFFICFDDFVMQCRVTEFGNVRLPLRQSFNYICGNGRELYLKTHVCMNKLNITQMLTQCDSNNYELPEAEDEACDKIKDITECMQKAVSDCGEDAKGYIGGFVKEMTSKSLDCGRRKRIMSIIIIAVAVVVAVVVFAAIAQVLSRRKK